MAEFNYDDKDEVRDELGKRSLPISEDHDANVEVLRLAREESQDVRVDESEDDSDAEDSDESTDLSVD